MKCIVIKKSKIDFIAEKKDVNIVYLTNGKFWVCVKNNYMIDLNNGFVQLQLAEKEGEQND